MKASRLAPGTLRRALLASLVVACAANVACSTVEYRDGYYWQKDPSAPACREVTWKQVQPERIPGLCGTQATSAGQWYSCSLGCVVVSPFSEEQAKHVPVFRETLYDHEARHVLEGLVHPVPDSHGAVR